MTEKELAYYRAYKKNALKRVTLDIQPEEFELIQAAAAREGLKPITFIRKTLAEKTGYTGKKKRSR